MIEPTCFKSAISLGEGFMIFMPFSVKAFLYQSFFSSLIFQPRVSASAAAFSTAACVLASRASKAFLFTMTAFLGSQACVSYQYLMLS